MESKDNQPRPRAKRRPTDAALREAAGAIADGRALDWSDLLGRTDTRLHSTLNRLRTIQMLADSCRTDETDAECLFTWGTLRVLEKVGEGGFGEVFRAWDPSLEREVALKLRHPSRARRPRGREQLEEARRLARLRHPNVLVVHGVEEHGGRAGMWTEYLRGETLERRLVAGGPLALEDWLRVARDLCRALAAVHEAGLVHGDVKAANVMLESGRVILMDFGAGSSRSLGSQSLSGTPLVMAPELFEGAEPSTASDLYALGVLLYRLASGRYPFQARTRATLAKRLRDGSRLPLGELRPDLPGALASVVESALAADPARRPGDARRFEAALRVAASDAWPDDSLPARPAFQPAVGPGVIGTGSAAIGAVGTGTGKFIGRRRELGAAQVGLLQHRLVTLVGPGGAGKTRLAGQCVTETRDLFPDGIFWVSLASLRHPEDVLREVAREAGVRESGQLALGEGMVAALKERVALVVMDNCEHLRPAAASVVSQLLTACPGLKVLATSREPLGVAEEQALAVLSLDVPPKPRPGHAEGLEVMEHESVRLFVDRVALAMPGFVLSRENAPTVARICRRLDGLPLALELAAARTRSLALPEVADRLETSLRMLARPQADQDPRQRTLEASIEWSWNLLGAPEQAFLRRLSVLAGSWSLAAAEQIGSDEELCQRDDVPDLLDTLVSQSLVVFAAPPAAPPGESPLSYRLLEPIREFAERRLAESGESAAVTARHFDWFKRFAERGNPALLRPDQAAWLVFFEAAHDDIRSALRWAEASPARAPSGVELAISVRRFWYTGGHFSEGMERTQRLAAQPTVPPNLRGRALAGVGSLAWALTDLPLAKRICEEALALVDREGDPAGHSAAMAMLGAVSSEMGDYGAAREYNEESLRVRRAHGLTAAIPAVLNNLGVNAACMGDLDGAIGYYLEAMEAYREMGDRAMTGFMMTNLASSYLEKGDPPRARAYIEECLPIVTGSGDRRALARSILVGGEIDLAEGRPEQARSAALEGIGYRLHDDDWKTVIEGCEILLPAEHALGRTELAAWLLGLIRARSEKTSLRGHPSRGKRLVQMDGAIRSALGDEGAEAAYRRGSLLNLDELLRCVRGDWHAATDDNLADCGPGE